MTSSGGVCVMGRGVGAMELVAMQLKAEGMLVSRSLSFEGCSFDLMPLVNNKFQVLGEGHMMRRDAFDCDEGVETLSLVPCFFVEKSTQF